MGKLLGWGRLAVLAVGLVSGCATFEPPESPITDAEAWDAQRPDAQGMDAQGEDASGPECAPGEERCGDACVDVAVSLQHCGACGVSCGSGEVCSDGVCAFECGSGLVDCGGSCADLSSSTLHCGACDEACIAPANTNGALCVDASCRYSSCVAGFGDCDEAVANGCEVDTRVSLSHCGGCGVMCTAPANTVGATCESGSCGYSSCSTGYSDCDGIVSNGCEVNTRTSAMHCGGCGMACEARELCDTGSCVSSCRAGLMDCGSSCVDIATSPEHCGGCGMSCSVPANTEGASCTGGTCGYTRCLAGYENCDGVVSNGCEVDTRVSLSHCGGCGVMCASPAAPQRISVQKTAATDSFTSTPQKW